MFGSGVATLQVKKARLCIARYVLARLFLNRFGILDHLE